MAADGKPSCTGAVAGLVAAAFLRLLDQVDARTLAAFAASIADSEQPLVGEVEHEGEVFIVPNPMGS